MRLDLGLPGVASATIAAASIGENQQLAGTGVALRTFLAPPLRNGVSSEGGRVMGNADHQSAGVLVDIVDAVRDAGRDVRDARAAALGRTCLPTVTKKKAVQPHTQTVDVTDADRRHATKL